MAGYPTSPPDDWHPVPILGPDDPLPADDPGDPHVFSPAVDGCMGLVALILVSFFAIYVAAHIVHMLFNLFW